MAEDIKSEQNGDERERNRGRVVRLQEMAQAAHGGAGLFPHAGASMRRGAHSRGDDPGFRNIGAGQCRDGVPAREDDDLVTQSFEFGGVRRVHDNVRARTRYLAKDTVDFRARADIDALRRLVGDDQARLRQ